MSEELKVDFAGFLETEKKFLHDIASPLAASLMLAEMLTDTIQIPDPELSRQFLRMIEGLKKANHLLETHRQSVKKLMVPK